MTTSDFALDPVAPVWLIAVLAGLFAAFAIWRLVVSPSTRVRVSWILRLVAVLLLAVVALRPIIPAETAQRSTTSGGLEVYIVVDTTSSMAAEDWATGQPRLAGVTTDIDQMAQSLAGANFSLVTFDGEAVQRVPLTSDATALRSASDALAQEITAYSRGSSVDEPVALLEKLLAAAAKANPDQRRVLFYLGDGEQTAATGPGSFASLAPYLSGGAVLGYGTATGGPMRQFTGFADPDNPEPYIQDYSSGTAVDAISKIDEERLGTIASQLGVRYTHRDAGSSVAGILSGFDVGAVTVTDGKQGTRIELYWVAAAPLGVIVLIELLLLAGALVEARDALPRRDSTKAGAK